MNQRKTLLQLNLTKPTPFSLIIQFNKIFDILFKTKFVEFGNYNESPIYILIAYKLSHKQCILMI